MNPVLEAKVAAIQMNSGPDVAANLASATALLEAAKAEGAMLAVLPENFALMGARESDKLAAAESAGSGPIQEFLAQAAQRLKLWIVAGTLPMKVPGQDSHVHAACLVYDADGQGVARYDKIHLFDVDVRPDAAAGGNGGTAERYRESASIARGAAQAVVVDTPVGRLGLSVCYDLRFPELYRLLSAAGAQILAVPSAFTERTGRAHWDILLRARAIENLSYVIAPNQCGSHPGGRQTWGHSLVIDPWGTALATCGDEAGIAVATVNRAHLQELRAGFPALNHRILKDAG